jgi:DNA alkylation repair enzyme
VAAAVPTRKRVERDLAALADRKRAKGFAWFFKTGKGEYGEGDRFLGITVPEQRKVALRNVDLPLDDVARLLESAIHEHRFTALEILAAKYGRADETNRSRIFAFYLRLWRRRIAIVSTLALVRNGEIDDTFRIAKKLLRDPHDLIHKAVGWALREAGKVSSRALLNFLQAHYSAIPRTTLRYAIERFPAAQRKQVLTGKFR